MKLYIKLFITGCMSSIITLFIHGKLNNKEVKYIKSYESEIPINYLNDNDNNSEETNFTLAANKSINAVVHIKNTSNYIEDSKSWLYNFYGESAPKRIGSGSGVIISPDGFIITNEHVIEGASEIEVTINNNKAYKAKLIGSD
ncbi:S1C family serine protease, partial [Flavobacteriaceae bacterium]|nr:S1C family serine protease [Flavobacteriaceae bacterium]